MQLVAVADRDDGVFLAPDDKRRLVDEMCVPLDVVLSGPGLDDEFLARAIEVDFDGTPVPVISPEDLIITKVLAGRPKDLEDIRGVLRERASRP